jgi:choloylglycine hydrolase
LPGTPTEYKAATLKGQREGRVTGRRILQKSLAAIAACALVLSSAAQSALACTGVTLKAGDGSIVFGRTLEWGSFDLMSRLEVVPRGHAYSTHMPDGKPGLSWQGKYGLVGIDAVGKDMIVEGMNEKGLAVGLFYHPGFADYETYDPAEAAQSMSPTDVGQYLLTNFATVGEVREAMPKIRVVAVVEPALGFAPPVHYIVTEPSGKAIVIEFLNGEMKVFDAPLGVITNAPSYDWHETNLRNYINLSPVALPGKKLEDLNFKPLGGGSGMIGLPGDFTPPSRFVRAVAFSKTARPTPTGAETIYEIFRILDNFNVPLGASEGTGDDRTQGMRSSTIWTSASDTNDKVFYYHTQHNRRVREVDLNKIDFGVLSEIVHLPLDKVKAQDIEDVTPQAR